MLKKTLQNQKEAEIEALKRQKLISEAAQRQQLAMGAYRAPVVANPAAKVNGTTPKTSKGLFLTRFEFSTFGAEIVRRDFILFVYFRKAY